VIRIAQHARQRAGGEPAALEEGTGDERDQRKENEQRQARPQDDDGGQQGRVAPERPRRVTPGD